MTAAAIAKEKTGLSLAEISRESKVSVQTLDNWSKEKPELFEIVLRGISTPKVTIADIENVMSEMDLLNEKRKDLHDLFIIQNCPAKVGDDFETNGFSHTGKIMRIDRIILKKGFNDWIFKMSGTLYKNNGELGMQRGTAEIKLNGEAYR